MGTPVRVQLSRRKGFRLAEAVDNGLPIVNCARPGRYGNPFQVGVLDVALAVEMFRDMVDGFFDPHKLKHLSDDEFKIVYDSRDAWCKRFNWGAETKHGLRMELRGKNLACWCPIGSPCHADALLEIANAPPPDAGKP